MIESRPKTPDVKFARGLSDRQVIIFLGGELPTSEPQKPKSTFRKAIIFIADQIRTRWGILTGPIPKHEEDRSLDKHLGLMP